MVLRHGERELRLKLVRVHTEYLADLGGGSYFACVDLADVSGDVYDVDFFLSGKPGAMRVTEATVHKLNGQPYYTWRQRADGTWEHIPVEAASPRELGVVTGEDHFEFLYRATIPELTAKARMWLPYPVSDAFQTVELLSIETPRPYRLLDDRRNGNKVLFLELLPEDSGKRVELRFRVQRREKKAYSQPDVDPRRFLQSERLVPITEEIRETARKTVAGKSNDLERARALYDHVIERMRYQKVGEGWGRGDALYACDAGTGNCTDYHSYFIALARAVGIPARFTIGASIPSSRDDGRISGYHCWAEFYAEGRWWPVDISEADKYSTLATYYFGHHPANRIALSHGRDIEVDPGPSSGPINFLAYPVLEVDGQLARPRTIFAFNRTQSERDCEAG
jgi:transglutaminase-like putative cysteine protease